MFDAVWSVWAGDPDDGDDARGYSEPDLSSMPVHDVVTPMAAWRGATRFAPGDPESDVPWIPIPDWHVAEGVPRVLADAARPKDAWEQAADWAQGELDLIEADARRVEVRRLVNLPIAYDTAVRDVRERFGLTDAAAAKHGGAAFVKQTALAFGMSPNRVLSLVHAARVLQERLPHTWAVFESLGCSLRAAEIAADELDGLDAEHWSAYDRAAAILVKGAVARLRKALVAKRERLQDDTAKERATRTAETRTVVFRSGRDGQGSLTLVGPVAGLAAIDTALTKAAVSARTDDETRTVTQLRFDVAQDLLVEGIKQHADPAWAGWAVPKRTGVDCVAAVTIPALAWLGITDEQATLEGVGPIALDTALGLAADAPSLVRILTDPITGVRRTMDRSVYAPPADLRRWVTYRDQRCRFPGCNRRSAECDVDHAEEWQHFGVTDEQNLICLCRGDHTRKTLGLFAEELRANGWVEWQFPWGRLVGDPPPDAADPAPDDLVPCPF